MQNHRRGRLLVLSMWTTAIPGSSATPQPTGCMFVVATEEDAKILAEQGFGSAVMRKEELAQRIKDALRLGGIELTKTINNQANLGKSPELVLAEQLYANTT